MGGRGYIKQIFPELLAHPHSIGDKGSERVRLHEEAGDIVEVVLVRVRVIDIVAVQIHRLAERVVDQPRIEEALRRPLRLLALAVLGAVGKEDSHRVAVRDSPVGGTSGNWPSAMYLLQLTRPCSW